jgi:hypothetical protein
MSCGVIIWSLGGVVLGRIEVVTGRVVKAALRFDTRHTQETSAHRWSTQPSTMQHPTAARRHNQLDNYKTLNINIELRYWDIYKENNVK